METKISTKKEDQASSSHADTKIAETQVNKGQESNKAHPSSEIHDSKLSISNTNSSISETNSSISDTNSSSSNTNTPINMATNTLANLRAVIQEFDTEESSDLQSVGRRFESLIENFEACIEFEGVAEAKKNPALLALGGQKFRDLCKTLSVSSTDTYAETKVKLTQY